MEYRNTKQFLTEYREYLTEHGITSAHVARKIGISPQQLQNIYRKQELTVTDVINLCNAIGYSCTISITPEI